MFEKFSEIDIEGSVWSDFSHLIGQSIQYEADDGSITSGVVQSVSVGDIWEEKMVTPVGAFLDVYAEIGKRLVCVGLVNLFGHGWNWGQIRTVTNWLDVHGFESVTTPIRLGSLPNVPNHRRFFVVTDVNVWEGCYCMVPDYSGNYTSTDDFVYEHGLIDLAKETFGEDWKSGGDYDYDVEEIKLITWFLRGLFGTSRISGGDYKIIYVESGRQNRENFERAKQKYFPKIKRTCNDGEIFVIPSVGGE